MVITISRETGSGGHSAGEQPAKRPGYAFYERCAVKKYREGSANA